MGAGTSRAGGGVPAWHLPTRGPSAGTEHGEHPALPSRRGAKPPASPRSQPKCHFARVRYEPSRAATPQPRQESGFGMGWSREPSHRLPGLPISLLRPKFWAVWGKTGAGREEGWRCEGLGEGTRELQQGWKAVAGTGNSAGPSGSHLGKIILFIT